MEKNGRKGSLVLEPTERWSTHDASELYDVASWGKGYFSVGEGGQLLVHPEKEPARSIDLKQLIDTLVLRGISLPILVRFAEILKHRLGELHGAFDTAIREHKYNGGYCCVYPIKVNQQRQVVEEVLEFGKPYRFGLEAGSKPELLAVMALADNDTPIICNGFKDDEYIEMAMLAQKIGRRIIPVVEKYTELALIAKYAERVGVRPVIGIRAKLASRGSGRWKSSGGYRSKFGLSTTEVVKALEELKLLGMADCLQLLHFHLGSQITNIRQVKGAVNEAARLYAELWRDGATGLKFLDVGGGLGIDYDGSQTDFESSVNYTLQEYANDIIYHVQNVCDEASVPHPTIITESGRAIVAYHSALVFNVLGVAGLGEEEVPQELPNDPEQPVIDLQETLRSVNSRNLLEAYHDAQQALDSALNLFSLGYLPLQQRCIAENLFWSICRKVQKMSRELEFFPEELEGLDAMLSDTYFCNFSLFQSMPDSWAINQLFPIMPIHRLNEKPTRHAVLGDITCDSDGKVDQFIDRRDVKRTLPLHEFNGQDYYLGAFLVGAYQEILGDLHNLFGDTNAVHVRLSPAGEVILDEVIKGDTVREVLDYVQFKTDSLVTRLRKSVEAAVREGRLGYEESGRLLRFYEEGLHGYTYLEDPHER
ncbi:MAG TPA: biosynthetic arginine decarboxylase [Bryobacteraceae bacterium]|nr:biosynthetic arginine decarboxylase [Bryobacteraceae bacterium]